MSSKKKDELDEVVELDQLEEVENEAEEAEDVSVDAEVEATDSEDEVEDESVDEMADAFEVETDEEVVEPEIIKAEEEVAAEVEAEAKEVTPVVAEEVEPVAPKEPGSWYVVHTQSGFEAKAKEALEQRIKSLGFSDRIFEIIVPMRDIVTINKGKKKAKKEKVFPGYILVRMILDNDSWIVVRTTQGITGFVGAGTKPTAISDQEVAAIMKFVKQEQPKFKAKFSQGEAVKVTDGPFSDFVGTISAMDEDKGKVTVLVSIFGRETPVELDFLQVNKL